MANIPQLRAVLTHNASRQGSRVVQRSKALHLSVRGNTTIPGSNPAVIGSPIGRRTILRAQGETQIQTQEADGSSPRCLLTIQKG
jgi:hypothetical protein